MGYRLSRATCDVRRADVLTCDVRRADVLTCDVPRADVPLVTCDVPRARTPRRRDGRGFTLVELLVVLSLISILAAMGMVQYRNSVRMTQEGVLKRDLFLMRDAIDQYYADKNKYPASLDALVSDQYLRKIPEDPITQSADTWQTVPAEPDPANPTAEPGIYDVKSGAQGQGLDGSNYSDW